jgi:phenylalanine-4-hydroxylase
VNHLVLEGGCELTGRVAARLPAEGPPAVVRLAGPVLLSRAGVAEGRPFAGDAVVVLGQAEVPERGAFDVEVAPGVRVSGFAAGAGEVLGLRVVRDGVEADVPPWAILAVARSIPSVAGGPADPAAWDRWFGELSSFAEGDGEARARARKAAALPPALGALYEEVRRLRERGGARLERLLAIRDAAAAFAGDWLLREEVDELLGPAAAYDGRRPPSRAGDVAG